MKQKLKDFFKSLYASFIRAQEQRAAIFLLNRMSKRELDDLGIIASDIPQFVKSGR